jgi:hypothetical protein
MQGGVFLMLLETLSGARRTVVGCTLVPDVFENVGNGVLFEEVEALAVFLGNALEQIRNAKKHK